MDKSANYTLHKVDPTGTGEHVTYAASPVIEINRTTKEIIEAVADRLGYKPERVKAVFDAVKKGLIENAQRGFGVSEEGVISILNRVKGSFETAEGPWVKGTNVLKVGATTLGNVRNAYSGYSMYNVTTGVTPVILRVADNTTQTENVVVSGHQCYISGDYLSLDASLLDKVTLEDFDGNIMATAVVSRSDRMSIDCIFTFDDVPAGKYYVKAYTHGGLGEEYTQKVAKFEVSVIAAA